MRTTTSSWGRLASATLVVGSKSLFRLGAMTLVAAWGGWAAQAATVIKPVAAQSTTTFTWSGQYSAANLWNASEFSADDAALIATGSPVPDPWPTGTEARPSGYWGSGFAGYGNDAGAWPQIIIDLGANYDLSAIVLWNGATAEGYWCGFKDVDIYRKDAYDLTVPGSGAQSVTFSAVPTPNAANAPQVIPVSLLNTRYVLLDCKDSVGNWFAGHVEGREIRFIGLAAGEPFPPAVQTQPTNQTMAVGATVSMVVQAVGGEPLTYQWQKEIAGTFTDLADGANIAGATTANLTLSNVKAADGGNYRAFVYNWDGSTNSEVATLTVIGQPTSEINLHAGIVVNGTVGLHYRVEYRTSLDAPDTWHLLQDIPSLPSASYVVYDPTPATAPKRFYQSVIVP